VVYEAACRRTMEPTTSSQTNNQVYKMKNRNTEQIIEYTDLEAQPALRQALSNLNETFMKSLRYLYLPLCRCGTFKLG